MREFIGTIPTRISRLPRDRRGFPVPWFVKWIDGVPHFPIMDSDKLERAVRNQRCWICGNQLGGYKAFVIGPMCCVNRVTAEPPSHLDCAKFAVLNCPFMANPRVGRQVSNADAEAMGAQVAGIMIERNPGVSCIWVTKSFKVERHGNGVLFRIGPAHAASFWALGRAATRAEVDHSVDTGLPILRDMAAKDDVHNGNRAASEKLQLQIDAAMALIDSTFMEDVQLGDLGFGDHVSGGPSNSVKDW